MKSVFCKRLSWVVLLVWLSNLSIIAGQARQTELTVQELLVMAREEQLARKADSGEYARQVAELGRRELTDSTWQLTVLYAADELWIEAVDNLDGDVLLDSWVIDARGEIRHEIDDRQDRQLTDVTSREMLLSRALAGYLRHRSEGELAAAARELEQELEKGWGPWLQFKLYCELADFYIEELHTPNRAKRIIDRVIREDQLSAANAVRLFSVLAQGYASRGDTRAARKYYGLIIDEYPNAEFPGGGVASSSAERELVLLTGQNDWLHVELDQLVAAVLRGIVEADAASLRQMASRSNFQVSLRGKGTDYTPCGMAIDSFLEYRGTQAEITPGKLSAGAEGAMARFLPTYGYRGSHQTVYLVFAQQSGGWEWRGYIYGRMSAKEIASAELLPLVTD